MARSTGRKWYGVDLLTWLCLGRTVFDTEEIPVYEERALMAVDAELLELYVDTLVWESWLSADFSNVDTYGTPVNLRAKIDAKTEQVVRATGDVVSSTHSIALDDVYAIKPKDRITMPSRFPVSQPEIMAVLEWPDENGPHHTTIKVGPRKGANA